MDQLTPEKILEYIIFEYEESKHTPTHLGFNIFPVISDTFYRENFHSDILKAFLSTNSGQDYCFGQHCDGDLYLQIFIEMLNEKIDQVNAKRKDKTFSHIPIIDGELYKNATAEREKHHIDILIKGDGHCIIIENKINDAPDMNKQMFRYNEAMKGEGYTVDALVYLTKTPETYPDTSSWNAKEKRDVLPYILVIPANDIDGNISLLINWIKPSSGYVGDYRCQAILEQYGDLIELLTPKFKKDAAMSKLLKFLRENPKMLKSELIPDEIAHRLPDEMARQLRESVREFSKDFSVEVGQWASNSCVLNLDDSDNKIWIYCSAEENNAYRLGFRGRWHDNDTQNYIVSWYPTSESEVTVALDQNGAYLAKDFKFGKEGEQELLNFISKLLDFAKMNLF